MKRFCIILIILTGFIPGTFAQQTYVPLNYSTLERSLDRSNKQIEHHKRSLRPQTWIQRGEIMMDIYRVDIDQIFDGIDKTTILAVLKDPLSTTTETIQGVTTEILEYERVNLYLQNNRLVHWEKTKSLVENPLEKAYEAFYKASELDTDGRQAGKIQENLVSLKDLFKQSGLNEYYLGNKKQAINEFMMVLKINDLDYFENEIDTVMLQYSGIIAREIDDYNTAAKQYEKLLDIGFGGPNTYLLLREDYLSMEDTARAIDVLERGFNAYPDSMNIISNLIDTYIKHNMIEKGLAAIEKSIKRNPSRGELYYWKGRIHLNSEDEDRVDKALDVYNQALEADPTVYYIYFDVGLIYYLQGQDLFSQAGQETNMKNRELINELAREKFEEAIPMLENADKYNESVNEIKIETLDTLRRIYYRLQMEEAYENVMKRLQEARGQ